MLVGSSKRRPCCITLLQAIAVQAWRLHIEWCSKCCCRCRFLEDKNLVSALFSANFFPLDMQHKSLELACHFTHVNASSSQLLHHASHDHCVYISQLLHLSTENPFRTLLERFWDLDHLQLPNLWLRSFIFAPEKWCRLILITHGHGFSHYPSPMGG
jgi:hypothetical protein